MGDVLHLKSVAEDRQARDARNIARPRIAALHRKIEAEIRAGWLIEIDGRVMRALTSFPSANRGLAWPGQMRLAGTLGKSDRTIRRSVSRLERRGFLASNQQGWNRTNCYVLMMDGKPLIPGAKQDAPATRVRLDPATRVRLDRTSVSTYLLESESLESESLESTSPRPSKLPRQKKRSADGCTRQVGEVIDRVVLRLGRGNVDLGWTAYRALADEARLELRNREREGTLDDELIDSFLQRGSA